MIKYKMPKYVFTNIKCVQQKHKIYFYICKVMLDHLVQMDQKVYMWVLFTIYEIPLSANSFVITAC